MWEGAVAAPASPLGWHSQVPVEVFFHTGHHHSTQELAREFTRQLDRQLSALSLLSAQRLLEGIRAYRAQGAVCDVSRWGAGGHPRLQGTGPPAHLQDHQE